jgi:hypothetical protein
VVCCSENKGVERAPTDASYTGLDGRPLNRKKDKAEELVNKQRARKCRIMWKIIIGI